MARFAVETLMSITTVVNHPSLTDAATAQQIGTARITAMLEEMRNSGVVSDYSPASGLVTELETS